MNFLAHHEFRLLRGLETAMPWCPHFCRAVALRAVPIHPHFKDKDADPFAPHPKPLLLHVLFLEYIADAPSLFALVRDPAVPFDAILALAKQVLMAVVLAQRARHAVHYDLHAENVLVQRCDPARMLVYRLDAHNAVLVPTFGYLAVIIDYGFGRSDDGDGHPMASSVAFTHMGYMSPAYDPFADAKIFLTSLSHDCVTYRSGRFPRAFRTMVKHLFLPLEIDWQSGWDRPVDGETDILAQLHTYVSEVDETSAVWTQFPLYAMDVLQHLVVLPLRRNDAVALKDLKRAFDRFMVEFRAIETEIHHTYHAFYVLHHLVAAVVEDPARRDQFADPATRADAVRAFTRDVFAAIDPIAKFCRLAGVDWEMLLCALFALQEQLGGHIHALMRRGMKRKTDAYDLLDVAGVEHIYAVLDLVFETPCAGTPAHEIVLLDAVAGSQDAYELEEDEWAQVNAAHHAARGSVIWELL
jgi:hypothetical protein